MFVGGLFWGGTTGSAEIPKEAMESSASVLETMATEKDMESSVPTSNLIAHEKERATGSNFRSLFS